MLLDKDDDGDSDDGDDNDNDEEGEWKPGKHTPSNKPHPSSPKATLVHMAEARDHRKKEPDWAVAVIVVVVVEPLIPLP